MTLKLLGMTLKSAHFGNWPFFKFDFPKVPVGPMGPNVHQNDRTDLLYTFTHSIESKNEIKFFSIFRPHLNFRTHFHQLPSNLRTTSAHQNDRTDPLNMFTHLIESKNVTKNCSIFSAPNSTWFQTGSRARPMPKTCFHTHPSTLLTIWVKKIFWKIFRFFGPEVPLGFQPLPDNPKPAPKNQLHHRFRHTPLPLVHLVPTR